MRHTEWWHGATIYQVYPRSFQDGDGDGVGDLPGITARLGHVADLGVDAVWLSPSCASLQTGCGHERADPASSAPLFERLTDFDALLARARTLGLRVIVDHVWSHTSAAHPWFAESRASPAGPRADWYVWADRARNGGPPNNWLNVFGEPAWTWAPERGQFYLHRFQASQPALDLHREDVVQAQLAVGRFWLDRGVDGLCLDAVDFLLHDPGLRDNPPAPSPKRLAKSFALQRHVHDMLQPDAIALLARVRAMTRAYPGACIVGEVSNQPGAFDRVERYTAARSGLHMAYTLRSLRDGLDWHALRHMLTEAAAAEGDGWPCWSFSSHDTARAISRLGDGSASFGRMLMALLLSLRGSACIYQGEELGLPQAASGRDASRTPMPWSAAEPHAGFSAAAPWLPIPPEHLGLAVDAQAGDPRSMLESCRAMLAFRRATPALQTGGLRPLALPEPLIGFERDLGGDCILAAFNFGSTPLRLDLSDYAELVPCGPDPAQARPDGGGVTLPGHGVFFAAVVPAREWQQEAALSFA